METRADKIRRLQALIAAEETMKAVLKKRGLYFDARQANLDSLKSSLEYEREMELKEIDRPVITQPTKKSWQDDPRLYIIVTIAVLVIAGIIVFLITNNIP
jgi:hypothetical protein